MESSDYPDFKQVIDTLVDAFPRKISESFYNTYWEVLKDLSLDRLKQNAVIHLRTGKFFPVPADLRNDPDVKAIALLAYDVANRATFTHGYTKTVAFEDPVINSAIQMLGGWEWFCNNEDESEEWRRKHFCDVYAAATHKKAHPDFLPGAVERENRRDGYLENIPKARFVLCEHVEQVEMLIGRPIRALEAKRERG